MDKVVLHLTFFTNILHSDNQKLQMHQPQHVPGELCNSWGWNQDKIR